MHVASGSKVHRFHAEWRSVQVYFIPRYFTMSDNGNDAPKGASLNFHSGVRSPPANQQKDIQKLELSFIELNKERAKQKEWKKLIRDLVFQRGKIPLLLAVEAGNQSMVRELLSAQTAEQLKVSYETPYNFMIANAFII